MMTVHSFRQWCRGLAKPLLILSGLYGLLRS